MRVGFFFRIGFAAGVLLLASCKPADFGKQTVSAMTAMSGAENYPDWENELAGKVSPVKTDPNHRAAWNRDMIVGAYKKFGRRNEIWDKDAIALMEQWVPVVMSSNFGDEPDYNKLASKVQELVALGCDDPNVKYMELRYVGFDKGVSNNEMAASWDAVGRDVEVSNYPPARKIWPYLRAADSLKWAEPVKMERISHYHELAIGCLTEMAKDPDTPEDDLYIAAWGVWASEKQMHDDFMPSWKKVDQALAGGKDRHARNVLKGMVYIDFAWQARGGGWAQNVTSAGWEGFFERLSVAEKALVTAWYQRPDHWQAPTLMISTELGQARGRKRMEKWFDRAMNADTNNWDAVNRKLSYLEPKWHGCEEDTLAFGRECAASDKWGKMVRLYIIDAHWNLSRYHQPNDDYFLKPGVWEDIKTSYDKYFEQVQGDYRRRSLFAYYGMVSDHPVFAQSILDELGTNVVKSVFGSDADYLKALASMRTKIH